jgi:hypothetical protein
MRFSLRTTFIFVALLCAALGWWVVQAARQKEAVAAVRDAGGTVRYTFEVDPGGGWLNNPRPWAPAWLRNTFGEDLFVTLDGVYFEGQSFGDAVIDRLLPKLRRVSTLRWLELRDSSITDASLYGIAELTQLERLLIRSSAEDTAPRTRITDEGLSQLEPLYRLNFLSLGGCTIDGSGFAELGEIGELQEIDLRDTDFTDASARQLRQFPHIKRLNLWATPITDAAIAEICHLVRLEELYLGDTKITDLSTDRLAKLTRLKVLDLSGTQVSDSGVERLRPLKQLQEFRLNNTQVQQANVEAFPNLQDLQIGWTRATDALLERASRLPKLRYLDCCECEHITDAGLKSLEKSKSLERLFFPDRRVISAEAVRSLQQAKPKLVINF